MMYKFKKWYVNLIFLFSCYCLIPYFLAHERNKIILDTMARLVLRLMTIPIVIMFPFLLSILSEKGYPYFKWPYMVSNSSFLEWALL
jgi:hypothetical protein